MNPYSARDRRPFHVVGTYSDGVHTYYVRDSRDLMGRDVLTTRDVADAEKLADTLNSSVDEAYMNERAKHRPAYPVAP